MSIYNCICNIIKEVSKKIKNINFGGCGWFAYLVGKEFNKVGVKCDIINYNYHNEIKLNVDHIKHGLAIPINKLLIHHFIIGVDNIFFDGVAIYKPLPKYWGYIGVKPHFNIFNLSDLKKLINKDIWCHLYDVKQNNILINIIKKNIQKWQKRKQLQLKPKLNLKRKK